MLEHSTKTVKRKILIGNEYKFKKLYECYCKWGTQNVLVCYLFDKPKINRCTKAIKDFDNIMHGTQYSVRITDIKEDGLIMLEMF